MGTPASLLDLIAHGGSLRAGLDNSQLAANTAETQARVPLINAQVPLTQAQTAQAQEINRQEAIKTQLAQRQLHDEEIQRQIWADAGKQLSTPVQNAPSPAAAGTGAPVSGPAPQMATPAFNPNAPAANASVVPDYLGNPRAYAMELARRGASAPAVMSAYTQGVDLNTKISKLTADQLAAEKASHAEVANSLQGYLNTPDEQKAQAYPLFYADAIAKEPGLKSELPPVGGAPTQQDLAHVIGKVGLFGQMLSQAKTKQETATSAAQAGESTAKAAELTQATDLAKFKFDLMRNATPETVSASVDGMSIFKGHPQEAQDAKDAAASALKATGDPEKATQAVQGVANRLREFSPAVIAGKANEAKTTAQAVAPVEVAKAVAVAKATAPIHIQEEVDKQVALAKNSPDAFAGIVDPRARSTAMTSYEKDSKEYADSVSAADQLSQFVKAAQSGNKAAPGLIPIAEVRQLVNRVNRTELQAAGAGAGSTFDKIEGWFKGHTEGQPIPPDVLKGISEISTLQAGVAHTKYANKVKITNEVTGAKLKPIDLGGQAATPAASAPVTVQTPHGPMNFPDAASADAFKKEAGLQ